MARRTRYRLEDIKEAIENIHDLLDGRSFDEMYADVAVRAAFERFLEIASEASRHLPTELTDKHPHIPWRRVADLGNQLRHAYHKADAKTLWDIYQDELDTLDQAIGAMLKDMEE